MADACLETPDLDLRSHESVAFEHDPRSRINLGVSIDPFLRWAGSKRKILPRLKPFWREDHERYVEPFAGSAALFFAIGPRRAILGDLNRDLVSTYATIKDDPQGVATALTVWETDEDTYYRVRDEMGDLEDPAARAARFVYLNRLCFNGLYRTNRSGHFNVPYGAKGAGRLPDAAALAAVSQCLRGATLVAKDFSEVLGMVGPGDLVYMDPPYRVASRRVFREYQAGEFSSEDLIRLRSWLEKLDKQRVDFIVSYADSREGRSLGKGFDSKRVRVRRNIAGFSKHRRIAYELMISNTSLQLT